MKKVLKIVFISMVLSVVMNANYIPNKYFVNEIIRKDYSENQKNLNLNTKSDHSMENKCSNQAKLLVTKTLGSLRDIANEIAISNSKVLVSTTSSSLVFKYYCEYKDSKINNKIFKGIELQKLEKVTKILLHTFSLKNSISQNNKIKFITAIYDIYDDIDISHISDKKLINIYDKNLMTGDTITFTVKKLKEDIK